jgi:hypothetical protein
MCRTSDSKSVRKKLVQLREYEDQTSYYLFITEHVEVRIELPILACRLYVDIDQPAGLVVCLKTKADYHCTLKPQQLWTSATIITQQ